MLNDTVLSDFVHGFYGYGNYQAPYWFVGMEEGGGHTLEDIDRRLKAWDARGRRELEDVADYHRAIGISEHFTDNPKLQPTWNKLIRIVLAAGGQAYDLDHIREYQKSKLGTLTGETCLLELMPLPSRSTSTWLFGGASSLPYLQDRETYLPHIAPLRAAHIQDRLSQSRPRTVIFYGQQYQAYWTQIAKLSAWDTSSDGFAFGQRENVLYVAVKHPSARGVANSYFHEIGRLIARRS